MFGPLIPALLCLCCPARRSFVKTQYPALKEANPHLPILIRESADVKPMLIARYRTLVSLDSLFHFLLLRLLVSHRTASLSLTASHHPRSCPLFSFAAMGVEVPVSLGGLSEADIESSLKEIASKE